MLFSVDGSIFLVLVRLVGCFLNYSSLVTSWFRWLEISLSGGCGQIKLGHHSAYWLLLLDSNSTVAGCELLHNIICSLLFWEKWLVLKLVLVPVIIDVLSHEFSIVNLNGWYSIIFKVLIINSHNLNITIHQTFANILIATKWLSLVQIAGLVLLWFFIFIDIYIMQSCNQIVMVYALLMIMFNHTSPATCL